MGDFPYLRVYKTSVKLARDKLAMMGITVDNVERRIAEYSGWDKKYWEKYRKFVLGQGESRLSRRLEKDGFSESDGFYPNVLDVLQ